MKALAWFLCGLVSWIMGLVFTFGGLVVLGWRRHGASPLDFTFLHLEWIFQPELPYWGAHMSNLATVGTGLVLVCVGCVIWIWLYRGRHKTRNGAPTP